MNQCSVSVVYKWHERFRNGRISTEDDLRDGRPCVVKMTIRDKVKDIIRTDRRTTVRSIAEKLSVSCSTVHEILTKELGMSKVSARWVPRLLTEEEKEHRVQCSSLFLQCYAAEGETFLD